MLRYKAQHVAHLDDYMPHLSLAQYGGHADLVFASDVTARLHRHGLSIKSGGTLFATHLLVATHLTTLYILQFGALFLLCLVVFIFVLCSEEVVDVHCVHLGGRVR